MTIDETTIRALIGFTDPVGVLSFYVGSTPAQAADRQPTAPIELRNQLRALTASVRDQDPGRAAAVERRLEQVRPELDRLLDARAPGRGRALFVAVEDGTSTAVSLQLPFRPRVVLHDSAYVRPLVAAHDEGREAGVLVVTRAGARVLRWSVGEADQLATSTFEPTRSAGDDVEDAAAGPADHGHRDRDRYLDRIDGRHQRFLRGVVEDVAGRAAQRGWDRLLLAGSPKVVEATRELLATATDLRVIEVGASWEDTAPATIAQQAWPILEPVRRERELALVTAARERALAGGPGALGLRHVCEALNAGRVGHLLYDQDVVLEGYVSEDGGVHGRIEGRSAQAELGFRREPLLVERMIEAAIRTGAKVTPIEREVTDLLDQHEGVAALLRW